MIKGICWFYGLLVGDKHKKEQVGRAGYDWPLAIVILVSRPTPPP